MTPQEIQVRSLYVFLACSQVIEQCQGSLSRTVPELTEAVKPLFQKSVKKELGLLFRYWATQHIWKALDNREADAKNMNLALLRLFFEGLRLPKDGSGLRYAELFTVPEQISELYHRLANSVGLTSDPLLKHLQQEMPVWRAEVMKQTTDALGLSVEALSEKIKVWAEREHESV